MKKTYNVSLGGCIFHLEEDAGDKLQVYIHTLEKYYSQEEGGPEIMSDIESRIAELFRQYQEESHQEVVTLSDVERVIDTLGHPDDLIGENPSETKKQYRKLYRDVDNRLLGGVAAGIAAYLNISVLAVRLCFLLLAFFYGFTIWLYLILWIIVPAALTSKQKLEMKGERINIPNIEKNIRDRFQEAKENGKIQETVRKTGNLITEILNSLGKVICVVGKIVLILVAVLLGIACLLLLIVAGSFLFHFNFTSFPFFEYLFFLPDVVSSYSPLLKISLYLTVITPLVLLIWLLIKVIFNLKNTKGISVALVIVWISGIVLLLATGIFNNWQIAETEKDITRISLPVSPDSCLFLQATPRYEVVQTCYYWGNRRDYAGEDGEICINKPKIKFESISEGSPEMILKRKGHGYSVKNALQNAKNIDYEWKLQSDTLYLDNYFCISPGKKWRLQEMEIVLRIPENYSVDVGFDRWDGPEITYSNGFEVYGKRYIMKNKRLQLKSDL